MVAFPAGFILGKAGVALMALVPNSHPDLLLYPRAIWPRDIVIQL
jgi:hypothetical protein